MSKEKNNEEFNQKDAIIIRSNQFIHGSRYKVSSVLESHILLACLKFAKKEEGEEGLVARLSTNELRNLMNLSGNSIYTTLKRIAGRLINKSIFFEDDETQHFLYFNMITKCEYQKGTFSCYFSKDITPHIHNLKLPYTSMSLNLLFSFKSNFSYRLYEIMKTHEYKIPKNNAPVTIIIPLSELKLELNVINTEEPRIRDELLKKNPDFDKIVNELSKEKKFQDYTAFRRVVLEPAIREVNEKSDIFLSFEPVRSGIGGRIIAIRFYVQKNIGQKDLILQKSEDIEEKALRIQEVFNIITDVQITQKDAIALLNIAENDLNRIERAYLLSKKQKFIKNFIGWMTTAIKEDYQDSIEVMEGSQENAETVAIYKENVRNNEDSFVEKTWEKIRKSDMYQEFEGYLEEHMGVSPLLFETLYPTKERISTFSSWLKKEM